MVLHHLARTQLGEDVVVDGVNKREFYVAQQKKAEMCIRDRFNRSLYTFSAPSVSCARTRFARTLPS